MIIILSGDKGLLELMTFGKGLLVVLKEKFRDQLLLLIDHMFTTGYDLLCCGLVIMIFLLFGRLKLFHELRTLHQPFLDELVTNSEFCQLLP